MNLNKNLNTFSTLMTSLNAMIGSGWLFSAFLAAQLAGSYAVYAWILGGFLIGFIALCFAELSSSVPTTGSIARYGQMTHGPIVGFIISWLAWLSCVAVAPTEVQATLMYASSYYDGLSWVNNDKLLLTSEGMIIAFALLFFFTCVNYFGIRLFARLNNILAMWKVFVPIITVCTLLYFSHHLSNLSIDTHTSHLQTFHNIMEAVSTVVIFSFLGFKDATEFGDEIKNPQFAIPIAVIGSVLFATLFYVIIQISFILSVPDTWITNGWAKLTIDGLAPISSLASALGLTYLAKLVLIDSAITPLSSVFIFTATTGRITFGMARNQYLPDMFCLLNHRGIPFNAILLNFFAGCLLLLPLPSWQILLKFQSSAIIIAYLIGPISLSIFRKTSPNIARPFKLPFNHILPLITFYICTMIVYWSGFETISLLSYVIASGLILFILIQNIFNGRLKNDFSLDCAAWIIYYLVSLYVISYLGNYGHGLGVLTWGLDYLCLGVISLISYYLAYYKHVDNNKINLDIRNILN